MTLRIVRWLGIAVLVIGYPLLVHYTIQSANNGNLGALVSIAPVVLFALAQAWRSRQRLIMLGVLALFFVALKAGWPVLTQHYGFVYWLQDAGLQLILLMTFGRTLFVGRQPLCTRFAEMLHAPLTQQHEAYARQVTVAWTLFFAVMALTSTLLFFLAPLATWSIFTNFLTLPLVALMFITEFWVRRWMLPDVPCMHILDAVQAFRNTSARPL